MILLGGMATLHGPIVGALAFTASARSRSSSPSASCWSRASCILVVVSLPAPTGLERHTAPRWPPPWLPRRPPPHGRHPRRPAMAEALQRRTGAAVLATQGLSRNFGGLMAVRDVSIALHHGELHAVIGPNGAGKSTLVNLLSGELTPTPGASSSTAATWPASRPGACARLGVGRSFQRTNIFATLSRARERAPRRAGGERRRAQSARTRSTASPTLVERRAARWPGSGWPTLEQPHGRYPVAWRAAPARDRHGAGRPRQGAAARRAARRHGPRGIAAHGGAAAGLGARARRAADRARHGLRVRGRRLDDRDGRRRGAGRRQARGDSRQRGWCKTPISEGHA